MSGMFNETIFSFFIFLFGIDGWRVKRHLSYDKPFFNRKFVSDLYSFEWQHNVMSNDFLSAYEIVQNWLIYFT